MASNTLFPPVVNSMEPAFITVPAVLENGVPTYPDEQPGELRVYFKYSALTSGIDKSTISVHATVHLKTGGSIVNTTDSQSTTFPATHRLRSTGIILNLKPEQSDFDDEYWYITLKSEDIRSKTIDDPYFGWIPGEVYKIQIRLSQVLCDGEDELKQQEWLFRNAEEFSEWSEVIYSKCISKMRIEHYDQYSFQENYWIGDPDIIKYPNLFEGGIIAIDSKSEEHYSSCSVKLYKSDNLMSKLDLLEEIKLYPNEISINNYKYYFLTEFEDQEYYFIEFSFITENKYQSNIYVSYFQYILEGSLTTHFILKTIDQGIPLTKKTEFSNLLGGTNYKYYTSLGEENDEGYIGLKLAWDGSEPPVDLQINLCIVRSSEFTNFKQWEDIKFINLNLTNIQDLEDLEERLDNIDMYFDYTIESNTYYKYAIQSLDPENNYGRGLMNIIPEPIERDFEYSYLLGKNQIQLKLKFDDTISSYSQQIYDTKIEPIGSQYPYIYRNSKINYKTFPINGLISFEMDDNKTFLKNGKIDIYKYEDVTYLHNNNRYRDFYEKYDRGYEKRFRQKVLDFLYDGEIKLFKSATEGNIIVRIRDINCIPNQQLGRLIYSFSAYADEIDANSMQNLVKYGLIYPGTYITNFNNIPDTMPSMNKEYYYENKQHDHNLNTSLTPAYFSAEEEGGI